MFWMVLPDKEVKFQLSSNGLYYFVAMDRENSVLLLNTVSENREGFTWREYKGNQEAWLATNLLGFLSERDSENMVRSKIIVNCLVTFDDVKNVNLFLVLISPRQKENQRGARRLASLRTKLRSLGKSLSSVRNWKCRHTLCSSKNFCSW